MTRGTWTDTYKQHNVALKYFRDSAEKEGLDAVNFSNTDPDPVAQIVHEKGMSYHFVGEPRIPWRWQEMVAQMTDDSMRRTDRPQSRNCQLQAPEIPQV